MRGVGEGGLDGGELGLGDGVDGQLEGMRTVFAGAMLKLGSREVAWGIEGDGEPGAGDFGKCIGMKLEMNDAGRTDGEGGRVGGEAILWLDRVGVPGEGYDPGRHGKRFFPVLSEQDAGFELHTCELSVIGWAGSRGRGRKTPGLTGSPV